MSHYGTTYRDRAHGGGREPVRLFRREHPPFGDGISGAGGEPGRRDRGVRRAGERDAGGEGRAGAADPVQQGRDHHRPARALRHRAGALRPGRAHQRADPGRDLHHQQGPAREAQDHRAEGVRQRHFEADRHHRRRPCRHGQDVSGRSRRRGGLPGQAGEPHRADPARCGGGRKAGLPAGRFAEQGRPLPAPAV